MVLLESVMLPENWQAEDFQLKGTDGKQYSLKDFKDKDGLLVIFTCNHCPYAEASWPVLIDLHQEFKNKVNFVAINPNDPETYPDDDFENMKKLVKEMELGFPYLIDATQEVAKTYKAQCTPDLYLFKKDGGKFKLYYHGRINDNWPLDFARGKQKVTEENLKGALQGLMDGKEASKNQPASMGCSIKWR